MNEKPPTLKSKTDPTLLNDLNQVRVKTTDAGKAIVQAGSAVNDVFADGNARVIAPLAAWSLAWVKRGFSAIGEKIFGGIQVEIRDPDDRLHDGPENNGTDV